MTMPRWSNFTRRNATPSIGAALGDRRRSTHVAAVSGKLEPAQPPQDSLSPIPYYPWGIAGALPRRRPPCLFTATHGESEGAGMYSSTPLSAKLTKSARRRRRACSHFEASKATGRDSGRRLGQRDRYQTRPYSTCGNGSPPVGTCASRHDPKRAIGKALTLEERADGVYISGRVVDPVTVSMIPEGVLQPTSRSASRGTGRSHAEGDRSQRHHQRGADRGVFVRRRWVESQRRSRYSPKRQAPDDHLAAAGEL